MKRMRKQLPAFLLAIIFCLSLLPGTAWAANFPSKFYASVTYKYESNTKYEIFGTVTQSADTLTYSRTGEKMDRVVYGMEYAGGVFFTVEGNKLPRNEDDGLRELRMYNSSLTSYRTIGDVTNQSGTVQYAIVDTAMDISGAEPVLYGTYQALGMMGENIGYYSYICQIDLTSGVTSNWKMVTGLESEENDIIYAIAFDKEGKLYAIGADGGADGGPASLYTIDLDDAANNKVPAQKVAEIKSQTGSDISTNFCQDLAFDHATSTLYWMENKSEVLYTVDTKNAAATRVGRVSYALQSFCIPYDAAFAGNKHMVSVICEGAGTVTSGSENKTFYMVEDNGSITLNITPDTGSGLRYVKVDGSSIPTTNLVENGYTFTDVTKNHVIEVGFKLAIPATQKTVTWLHYQGEPAKFYTVDNVYKFYDLPYLDKEVPREGYIQTLLDEEGKPIGDDEIILPGNYDVRVTHDGNDKYAALNVTYKDALQLGKCPGTPGRPVVYGKVGCTQGDLTTTSALQDYFGTNGELIDAAHDEIPVTLVWQNPETRYDKVGNFYASATIYAGELSEHILACYNLDDEGTPLKEGDQISSRNTQVIVLPADQASIIRLEASDDSGGTVSGKGVYKNGETVTVTAAVNADAGYEFKGWQENGSVVSNDATYTFNAGGDRTLTALFEVNENYRVILKTDPAGAGTVTGGGSYEGAPHSATVKATANPGYYFMGWYNGETQASTENPYTFTVTENGATLTAKFGIDYLARAEQAKENLESTLGTDVFEWETLVQAMDAYEKAEEFVKNPPSGITDAQSRFKTLTDYYNGVEELDLSDQNIDNEDLAELSLFTGVTDLDLSGTGVTDLSDLSGLIALETLDISDTGVIVFDTLVNDSGKLVTPNLETLTAQKLSLTSLSALAELVNEEDFDPNDVTKWDFTGSTLPDTEESKSDVETIKTKLGDKFLPPTIKTTPTGGGGGGGGGVATYSVTTEETAHGKVTVSPEKAAGGSTVTVTATPDSGYELLSLTVTDGNGNELELADQGSGKYTFTMPSSKVEIKAVFQETEVSNPFIDVHESDYFYDTVLWAVDNGITSGVSADRFAPNDSCTRAQIVAFLWRAYGSPKVTGSNPFTDVSADDYYYDALLWAVENGVTAGTMDTTFSPNDTCTRAQAVTFQWRATGSPAATGESFHDVAADAYYIDAVTWAVANNITVGTGAGNFSPDDTCTRAQIVTFLYRELA